MVLGMLILAGSMESEEGLLYQEVVQNFLVGVKYRELYSKNLWQYMYEELRIKEIENELPKM